ncbi:1-acylglycerol-3-phosphate O-acyltransferase [Alteromonas aestuariivivens]|uniref:1-acyl-sn-glycerol-3-phosphate acyltransferase n=1 Tax=Alteromonas aestuariivivens TaxID=1938339 RepID=A0A3D8MDY1_9ALTE|nr:1-acylglycerol-3-phosphate O-acyltransferase [Alteromonas aestuariivivens]RDV28953.1 1-acylglycerol-3-phosphate O-acyltransferase [Alteromonas aestuariivivens]
MLAVLRILILLPAFLLINLVILLVCVFRPFHSNNVHFAGQAYSLMSRIVGLKVIVRRSDKVTLNEPYVFIANHQNSYDIITVCKAALPGVVTIGKKSLKYIPVFGQIYWLSGNIMIDRKNSGKARGTLQSAAEKIRQKRTSVWVFPEGTRSNGRGLLPFKTGAFRLAKDTGEPVVMVTASNLHKKVNWNRWNNGIVLVDIDAPQPMSDELSIKQWAEHFHSQMAQKQSELNAQVAEMEKSS